MNPTILIALMPAVWKIVKDIYSMIREAKRLEEKDISEEERDAIIKRRMVKALSNANWRLKKRGLPELKVNVEVVEE